MARKSKKLLFENLARIARTVDGFSFLNGVGGLKLDHKNISNETYGKDSRVYVHTPNRDMRERLERLLRIEGFEVDSLYSPRGYTVDVGVSYFKGKRWNV